MDTGLSKTPKETRRSPMLGLGSNVEEKTPSDKPSIETAPMHVRSVTESPTRKYDAAATAHRNVSLVAPVAVAGTPGSASLKGCHRHELWALAAGCPF